MTNVRLPVLLMLQENYTSGQVILSYGLQTIHILLKIEMLNISSDNSNSFSL